MAAGIDTGVPARACRKSWRRAFSIDWPVLPGQFATVLAIHQVFAGKVDDPAESRDKMGAAERHAIEAEIAEVGVSAGLRMVG